MARFSHWTRLRALEKRFGDAAGRWDVELILCHIVDPAYTGKVTGVFSEPCAGYEHQYPKIHVDFDPPISPEDVPARWLALTGVALPSLR